MFSRLVVYAAAAVLAASWIGGVERGSGRATAPAVSPGPDAVQARTKKSKSRSKKRRSKRARNNMPKGWTWPVTSKMKAVGKACLAALDSRGVAWRKASSVRKVATPITLPGMEIGGVRLVSTYRPGPFVMDCHLVLGLADFATTLHALGVRELRFSRIHDYTQVRVNGAVKRALSRHALGIAIDIRAFVDDAGNVSTVETDYPAGDELLLAVESALNASGKFRTVLTPGNDPASHDDHFHIEVGVDYTVAPQTSSL
jgi:hypothetical protein